MASKTTPVDQNHIDHWLGTSFGSRFVLDNVIDGAIAFANGDVTPDAELHTISLGQLKDPDGTQWYLEATAGTVDSPGEILLVDRAKRMQMFSERAQESRGSVVEILEIAVAGLTPLAKLLKSYGDIDDAVDLALYPTLTFEKSGRPVLGWRISGSSDIDRWGKFAAVLIADKARGELTDIGRCHLEGCGRFFRIARGAPGKPSRKYCPGTDHMERAHKLGSTARTNRKRAFDRVAAKTKKARRPK
jgi:hypothetical protein